MVHRVTAELLFNNLPRLVFGIFRQAEITAAGFGISLSRCRGSCTHFSRHCVRFMRAFEEELSPKTQQMEVLPTRSF